MPEASRLNVKLADLNLAEEATALVALMEEYARDPMGGGQGLSDSVKAQLPAALKARPQAFTLIAWLDGKAIGLVNCFEGFSTFKCQPLINIHDVIVSQAYRGQGIAQRLLQAVEALAREKGCCKLTLEVLQGNARAQKTYTAFGFSDYQLDPAAGSALFWEKPL